MPQETTGQKTEHIRFDYVPFEYTIRLHRAFYTHRIRAAVTGARAGKTTAGVADVRDRAIKQPGYTLEDRDAGKPYTIAIGAPDYPILERVVLPAWLRAIPKNLIIEPYRASTKHYMIIQGEYGPTQIFFLSAGRPESWQGLTLYGAWIDEFPLIHENMFNEALTRLSDHKGWLLMTGTPRGPNWVKERIYNVHEKKLDPDMFFISWKTVENPYIDAKEIDRLRKTMPVKYFKRTFEASWDVFEGQIYEEFMPQVHVFSPDEYRFLLPSGRRTIGRGPKEVRFKKVIAGVDWGYGVGHPGCILVLGVDANNRWYVVEESVGEQILVMARNPTLDSWIRRAVQLTAKWEIGAFFCDTASPQYINTFKSYRLKARPGDKRVKEGIQAVADCLRIDEESMESRLLISSACQETISEMTYYHWKEGKEEPEKVNDHTMDALRYAIFTYFKRGTFIREKNYIPR